jgi:hypothetical protein
MFKLSTISGAERVAVFVMTDAPNFCAMTSRSADFSRSEHAIDIAQLSARYQGNGAAQSDRQALDGLERHQGDECGIRRICDVGERPVDIEEEGECLKTI